jgi:hypothetical protein
MRAPALLLVVLVLGCGTVTADPKDGAAGAAGAQAAAGAAGGAGELGGHPGAGGELGGRGGAAGGAAGGELGGQGGAGAACLTSTDPNGTPGFAYNVDNSCGVDAGRCLPDTAAHCCYAHCELNGAQFVGCVADPKAPGGAIVCYASCADCP